MKSTKRALFTSVISLLLCITMLIGATFAWFTDDVKNTGNRIIAGNLDIDLVMDIEKDGNYTSIADGRGDIFSEDGNGINWEPGKTEVVYLGVRNLGSLALKYNILLKVTDGGLASALEYVVVPEAKAGDVPNWDAVKANKANVPVGETLAAPQGTLDEIIKGVDDETDYFALVVHMKEEAGNEYMEKDIVIDLYLNATQKDAEFDSFGKEYDQNATLDFFAVANEDELKQALNDRRENILITEDITATTTYNVDYNVTISGGGKEISRADGFTGTIFSVKTGATLTMENVVIDGGAIYNSNSRSAGSIASAQNTGVTATGNLIATTGNGSVVLNKDAILQNNDGASAVSLATRGGGSLTLNGAQIINNRITAGGAAIWGGGNITINEGSKINNNHATTGLGGAIRMVDGYNNITFTMNGGEMNYNTAVGTGGAIWGGNRAKYYFNGGEMAYNSAQAGGAIWTGTYESYTFAEDFKLHDNSAVELGGAIRFCDHTSLAMTGGSVYNNTVSGESSAFFLNNNTATITGGEIKDDFSYSGGLGFTLGEAEIDGVVAFNLTTNHNTAYLKADFGTINFTVNEANANFSKFNFKAADDYVYTAGDEAKLVCKNPGYTTYWDETTKTFRLKAE